MELGAVRTVQRRALQGIALGRETGDEHLPGHRRARLVHHEGLAAGVQRRHEVAGGLELEVVAPVLPELEPGTERLTYLRVGEPAVDRAERAEHDRQGDEGDEEEGSGEPVHECRRSVEVVSPGGVTDREYISRAYADRAGRSFQRDDNDTGVTETYRGP